ncbi:MAG TPA: trigger factor [Candidatus Hydrogenedentes bacterium]|nr:trigger factor [Candidatus Hydrogenedentota bacterium]
MSDQETVKNTEQQAETPASEPSENEREREHAHDHPHDHHHDHDHHHGHDEEEFTFTEPPVFDVSVGESCDYTVKTSIPAVNILKEIETQLEEMRRTVELPGFRRGKAPVKLLQNKFGRVIREDTCRKMLDEAFKTLVKERDLRPVTSPKVADFDAVVEAWRNDQPLEFTMTFETSPEVELCAYRGIEAERPTVTIEAKDIDEVLENQRQRFVTYEVVEDAATLDDQVLIDFEGTIDGQPFDGNRAENYPYLMGASRLLKPFETALLGHKVGDTVEADVTFPEDWRNKDVAGKTARFKVTIKEIKRRVVPELNDDLAKKAGFDSLEAWRKATEESMRERVREQSDSYARANALQKIIEQSSFRIPESMIDHLSRSTYEELRQQRRGETLNEEQENALRAEARERAIDEIKRLTVIQEIAEAEGIEVTDEDLDTEAQSLASNAGVDVQMARDWLGTRENRSRTEWDILVKKVLDTVMAHAKVVDKELPREEETSSVPAEEQDHAPSA